MILSDNLFCWVVTGILQTMTSKKKNEKGERNYRLRHGKRSHSMFCCTVDWDNTRIAETWFKQIGDLKNMYVKLLSYTSCSYHKKYLIITQNFRYMAKVSGLDMKCANLVRFFWVGMKKYPKFAHGIGKGWSL